MDALGGIGFVLLALGQSAVGEVGDQLAGE